MIVEPKQISVGQFKYFSIDALDLCKRKIISYLILTFAGFGTYWIIDGISYLPLICTMIIFTIGCIIAKCADENENVVIGILSTSLNQWIRVMAIFIGYFMIIAAILLTTMAIIFLTMYVISILDPSQYSTTDQPTILDGINDKTPIEDIEIKSASESFIDNYLFVFVLCTAFMPLYHLLILFMNPPIRAMIDISARCLSLNIYPLFLMFISALVITPLSQILPYLYIVLVPFLSALNYIIYRAIYTDRDRNKKVEERSTLKEDVFVGQEAKT